MNKSTEKAKETERKRYKIIRAGLRSVLHSANITVKAFQAVTALQPGGKRRQAFCFNARKEKA